jgi:transcriptional regulator with XRE-family HTH domain
LQFGSDIAAARKARGWTQEQLAKQVGISRAHLANVESGNPAARASEELRNRLSAILSL